MGFFSSSTSEATSGNSGGSSSSTMARPPTRPLATMHADDQHSAESCFNLLKKCEMFQRLSDDRLQILANNMEYKVVGKNAVLLTQGQKSDRFFMLESGDVRRKKVDEGTGKAHNVEYAIKANSINSMKVISGDPVYATTKCTSNECRLFEMKRDVFLNILQRHPDMALSISAALCEEIRKGSRKYATPMLEQTQQDVNIPAVSIAAGIESYYRSALNAILNRRLTATRWMRHATLALYSKSFPRRTQ